MEEPNETMVMNDTIENNEEEFEETTHGVGAAVAVVVGLLAVAGAAVAAIVAKQKGKLNETKAKRNEHKIERLEKKLEKCYVTMDEKGEVVNKSDEEE